MATADIVVTLGALTRIEISYERNGAEVDYMGRTKSFVIGDTIAITARFYVSDALTDPGAVTCTIEEPDGTNSSVTLAKQSVGVYGAPGTFVPDQVGQHRVKIEGTTTAAGVKESVFYVHSSGII